MLSTPILMLATPAELVDEPPMMTEVGEIISNPTLRPVGMPPATVAIKRTESPSSAGSGSVVKVRATLALTTVMGFAVVVNPTALAANNVLHRLYRPIIQRFGLTTLFSLEADKWLYLKPIADALDNPATDSALRDIVQMKRALTRLSQLPTARLDRLFSEHLDICSHRLDAWLLGLLHQRLDKLRKRQPTGIGIGAFGYLLGLKPNPQRAVVFEEVVPEYLA